MNRTQQELTSTEVREFRHKLEIEKREAASRVAQLDRERHQVAEDGPHDSVDVCVINLSRESLFERSSAKRQLLNHITVALRRIDDGSFGVCSECGEPINRKRLQAMPWTSYCLHCQEEMERA
jgi:DnaK suppressor protein